MPGGLQRMASTQILSYRSFIASFGVALTRAGAKVFDFYLRLLIFFYYICGMELKTELSERLHIGYVRRMALLADNDTTVFAHIYSHISDSDDRVGYNALWVLTHCATLAQQLTQDRANELIDSVIVEPHTGKRRLMLTLLEAVGPEYRGDFFDFCLEKAMSRHEAYGVRALCLKLAYAQARSYPELLAELKSIMDFISSDHLSPGLTTAIRNILKKIDR